MSLLFLFDKSVCFDFLNHVGVSYSSKTTLCAKRAESWKLHVSEKTVVVEKHKLKSENKIKIKTDTSKTCLCCS